MSLAVLMVHFDGKPAAYRRLRLAADLANRFEAALIGIAGRSYLPSFLADGNTALQKEDEQEEMAVVVANLGDKFRTAAKHVSHVEWRGVVADATHLVINEARAADLIIIGREQDAESFYYTLNPSTAVVRMGRPVLLVPDGIETLPARRIVVAWKDTREARRAVRDAIPFLQRAERVTIAEVCEQGREMHSPQELNDVSAYLGGHKVVVAEKAYLHTKDTVESELLRFAKDEKADLVVAGAYGQSRLGEWVFGGVTRGLMENCPICNLFSH